MLLNRQEKEEKLKSDFISMCVNGDARLSEVDDYVEKWHDSNSKLPLYKYLGMTREEYALFIQDEGSLAAIVATHKNSVATGITNGNYRATKRVPLRSKAPKKFLNTKGIAPVQNLRRDKSNQKTKGN